jgi:transposase
MHKRQEKTFTDNLKKDFKKDNTALKKLGSTEFACEPDARAAAEKWIQTHSRYRFRDFAISPVTRKTEKRRGRPKVGDPVVISFSISAAIEYDNETIERERLRLGRFVLATNDPELSVDTILTYYKGQGKVEGLFRFLKDKSFRVAEIFLKNNSRIQALAMIMVLCLFIYSMTEFRLRRELARSGETVTSQTKKQTNRPTLKWVFFTFRRVRIFSVVIGKQRMTKMTNMTGELRKILQLLGPPYEKYYS